MSLSPAGSYNEDSNPNKRRRRSSSPMSPISPTADGSQQPSSSSNIPKRGARACTNCRKGKNRCEGEPPCRRCQLSGLPCIFEKPEKKGQISGPSIERLSRLEGQYLVMQSQMIGMQSSLDRILAAVQTQQPHLALPPGAPPPGAAQMYPPPPGSEMMQFHHNPPAPGGSRNGFGEGGPNDRQRPFPPLPGFAPPPHKYATYGIIPSTAPSSEDESEDTLPRAGLNAPIEALQGLANAAAEAAAAPATSSPRVKKRKRAEPIPRNAFPHVVEKGLVSEAEARELYHIFFSGCHYFIPLFDPTYDTYENISERSPWTFDAILAVAGKIKSGNGPLSATFYRCLEEAQGIARSSLFGPVVRKEAVEGMMLLAAWSTNGWLPSGHAMRMALDLGLHRALDKLADDSGRHRSEEEERDIVVSSRIWLCLYWFDHQMSLGTGRPIVLRDETYIRHCRVLLKHPMSTQTDVRVVAQVELIVQKAHIYDSLTALNGQVNQSTLGFIRRANDALDKWFESANELHGQTMEDDSLLHQILLSELHYAKLWVVCVALRGVSWDKMPFEQRELAFQAKDEASKCLNIFLTSHAYRAALRYAVHDSLVTAAFSGLFLLKMANLFPGELDLPAITAQVEQLAQLLSEVAAERYALTLRIMLANLRRKLGLASGITSPGPTMPPPTFPDNMMVHPHHVSFNDPTMPPPFTMEELGFAPPANNRGNAFNPTSIPVWLQEQSLTDLGLPINGSDGIFLNMAGANGWTSDFPPMPEAW